MLVDAGCPVGNQAVLMKGVNDDPDTMRQLMKGLLAMRVRPYYIYQADLTKVSICQKPVLDIFFIMET